MKLNYYVVLPNLSAKGMTPAVRFMRALLEINKETLAEALKFFAHDEAEARAYMESLPRISGKSHCMVTLTMEHDAVAFLTSIKGVKRFYSIETQEVVPIAPAYVSAMSVYPMQEPLPAPFYPFVLPKTCTPISDTSASASDPALMSTSSSAPVKKDFKQLAVLEDLPCFIDDKGLEASM